MANAPKQTKGQGGKSPEPSKNAVAKIDANANLPTYLAAGKGTKLQHLDMQDFVVPRIKLLQGLSEEVKNYENAIAGEFWMTVADQPLGKDLEFVVCANTKRYLLLAPMADGQGVLARADDCKNWTPPEGEFSIKIKNVKNPVKWTLAPTVAESGLAEFGSSNPGDPDSPPAATLFYDYLVYLPDYPKLSPAMLSLARSQAKKAKDLNGKLELANVAIQSMKVQARVVDDKSDDGDFYNYAFSRSGWAEEEVFNKCVAIAERFQDKFRASDAEYASEGTAGGPPAGATKQGKDDKTKEY